MEEHIHAKEKTNRQKQQTGKVPTILASILLIISVGFAGGWLGARSYNNVSSNGQQSAEQARKSAGQESELISSIAEEVGPSVVSISVRSRGSAEPFFGNGLVEQESAGTGFIISEDGYVITNRHVIPKSATKVTVIMSDGTEYEGVEVIGRTKDSDSLDIAVLKISAGDTSFNPVELGDSNDMQVGDMVVAIGNALGEFQNTVTSGIISGYGRNVQASGGDSGVESLINLFQTDAAINQGNSGGPLVNANGEVIGVNTAVAGDAENIGFAIPINDVQGIIKGVLETGQLQRPYLGVRYIQLDAASSAELGIEQQSGAYIAEDAPNEPAIIPDSPADKAGLKTGDIITAVNNFKIDSKTSLASAITRFPVGDTVTVTFLRDGKEQKVEIKLEASP